MLLIYTTSFDTTVDLLLHHMGAEGCFRYNFDLWRDYRLQVSSGSFHIQDPTGRSISDQNTSKILWRKPFQTKELRGEALINDQDGYCEEELWYVLREIVNLLWLHQKVVLVEPRADSRLGKFVQAIVAGRYFLVPDFEFRFGDGTRFLKGREAVTKSLTSKPIGGLDDRNVLYATRVIETQLSPSFPWMVQEYVDAEKDVTVVVVRDRLFAFELARSTFIDLTIDWRELPIDNTASQWTPHELPEECAEGIFRFMKDLGLHFGRIDFLLSGDSYYFLEINPNGQWSWLDTERKHGLLDKFIDEVSPFTSCHPIPTGLSVAW